MLLIRIRHYMYNNSAYGHFQNCNCSQGFLRDISRFKYQPIRPGHCIRKRYQYQCKPLCLPRRKTGSELRASYSHKKPHNQSRCNIWHNPQRKQSILIPVSADHRNHYILWIQFFQLMSSRIYVIKQNTSSSQVDCKNQQGEQKSIP